MLPAAAITDHHIDLASGESLDHWVGTGTLFCGAPPTIFCVFWVKDQERARMNFVGAMKHELSVIARRIGFRVDVPSLTAGSRK
jgi:hypothetical protein